MSGVLRQSAEVALAFFRSLLVNRGSIRNALVAASCGMALGLQAQPVPRIDSISPEWIQRGSTVEVTLSGANLGAITRFVFDGQSGLSATNIPKPMAVAPAIALESVNGVGISSRVPAPARDETKLRVQLTAAGTVLGPRELRVVSETGISNPVRVNVGQWPESMEKEPNDAREQAQAVLLPVTLNGVISGGGQSDWFKFHGKKGEEIVLDVDATANGSALDSSLALINSDGKELARNEDEDGLDSLLQFVLPAESDYFVQLRDFRYQGGGNYNYRLSIGALPYLSSVFPFGAQRGSRTEVALQGRNLEGTSKMILEIAADAPLGRTEIRATTPHGLSTPVPFDVQPWPEVTEVEPNNALDKAQTLSIPGVINGRIGSPGDIDFVKFKSGQDQKLICEVVAGRFRSRLDPLLVLMDAKGAILQQNDDTTDSDARIELDAKKDVEYVLSLRDLTDGGGDGYVYRLLVRPPSPAPAPGFTAKFLPDALRVHRGGVSVLRCEVARTAGFNGPVRFEFENLPSGVFCEPLILGEGPASGLMVLSASKDARLGSEPVRLLATGTIGSQSVSISAGPSAGRRGYLTVLEAASFTLEPLTLAAVAEQDGSTTVEVLVERKKGFEGEVKLAADGYSAGRDPIGKSVEVAEVRVKGTETVGRLKLKPKLDSEIGTRTIVVKGETTLDGAVVTEFTRPFPLTISQIPFLLSSTLARVSVTVLPSGSESAAGEAATVIKVERRDGFKGDIALALEGMPSGIKTELSNISSNATETILKMVATDKAAAGTNVFTVIGTGVHNDRTYKRVTDKVTLTVSVPAAAEPPKAPVAAVAPREAVTATK